MLTNPEQHRLSPKLGKVESRCIPQSLCRPKEGTGLSLEPNDNPVAKTYQEGLYKTGLPVIVFSVPDVPREYERLSRAGVVFRQPPTPTEAGLAAVFDYTCGNFIQLFQG